MAPMRWQCFKNYYGNYRPQIVFFMKNCNDKLIGIRICIDLAPWIRIRLEVKSRIQIRIETNYNTVNYLLVPWKQLYTS
jgi:hypothetical protein